MLAPWTLLSGYILTSARMTRYANRVLGRDLIWRTHWTTRVFIQHYSDVTISAMVSQITGVNGIAGICSSVCSGADKIKHQSTASLAFVKGIHHWPVNCPPKGPVKRKMFPFGDVIMQWSLSKSYLQIDWSDVENVSVITLITMINVVFNWYSCW